MALEIRVDLFPLVRILNDGTIYRFMGTDTVPPENSGVLVTSHDITLDATKGVYVRVYVPTTTCQIGEKLPVVVYIHGGGFCIESAASPTYHNLKIDAYKIANEIASAVLYLHEGWDECVLHRDIKSSNVLLDSNFSAKIGDFGLARMVTHERLAQTTRAAGTLGYLAPECVASGKTSAESDVYSFGAMALEIACGKKVIDESLEEFDMRLVAWVWNLYDSGVKNQLLLQSLIINLLSKMIIKLLKTNPS